MKTIRRLLGASLVLVFSFALLLPANAAADANDFVFRSFEADYRLSFDAERRSQLDVTERLVAEFPDFDQNHGIERAIPDKYDGHTVSLRVMSVTDAAGGVLNYTTYGSNGNTVLRIGDADRYVRGVQTYVINYRLRDVVKEFGDHSELYWDTNGTGWSQPFGSVTARLHIPAELAGAYDGRSTCFVGAAGSTEPCVSSSKPTDTTIMLTYESGRELAAGENVTFVAGFASDTFVPYQPTFWERLLPVLIVVWLIVNAVILVAAGVALLKAARRFGRSPEGRGTIVPEYLPPKNASVLVASTVVGKAPQSMTAQMIDLAVRHYLKIYETEAKSWFRSKRTYEIELVKDPAGLSAGEKKLIDMLLGNGAVPGQRVALETLKTKLYQEATALQKESYKAAEASGFFADITAGKKRYYWIGGLLTAAGFLMLLPAAALMGIITLVTVAAWRPLTEKGVGLKDYMQGLKMYMELAEADRLQQLQSPDGAARSGGIDTGDKKQLVKLYERLLPYAMLFGIEKEWLKQFAPLYEQPPDWYGGNWAAFNGAVFASSLNDFAAVSKNTFTPPNNSSSSGFSGGGSSGGGGGGGGGGGW